MVKARVSHMITFTWLKTEEYNHNDDQILKAIKSRMIKVSAIKIEAHNCFGEIFREAGKIDKTKALPNYED